MQILCVCVVLQPAKSAAYLGLTILYSHTSMRVLQFQGLFRSLRNTVLHYPDVYKHPGSVVLSAIAEKPINSVSCVLGSAG